MTSYISTKTGSSVRRVSRLLQLPLAARYTMQLGLLLPQEAGRSLGVQIDTGFKLHKSRYGYRRFDAELKEQGVNCAPTRVRRLINERGLEANCPRQFVPKTSGGRANASSLNRVAGRAAQAPNVIWAGDITYVHAESEWLYFRRVLSWILADHKRSELVCDALKKTIAMWGNVRAVIFYSDRSSQYGSRQLGLCSGMLTCFRAYQLTITPITTHEPNPLSAH